MNIKRILFSSILLHKQLGVTRMVGFIFICVFSQCTFYPLEIPYDKLIDQELIYCKNFLSSYYLFQENLPSTLETYTSIDTLFASVKDAQTCYWNKKSLNTFYTYVNNKKKNSGIVAVRTNEKCIITDIGERSAATLAGVHVLDTLIAINGSSVHSMTSDSIYNYLTNQVSPLLLTIKRQLNQLQFSVKPDTFYQHTVFSCAITKNCAYIQIAAFLGDSAQSQTTSQELEQALIAYKTQEYLIIDIRMNTVGNIKEVFKSVNLFVESQTQCCSLHIRLWDNKKKEARIIDTVPELLSSPIVKGKKLFLLVDGTTAGGAELFCLGLQYTSMQVQMLGQKTKGMTRLQVISQTPDSGIASVTHGIMKKISGTSIDGIGLMPDIVVPQTADCLFEVLKVIGLENDSISQSSIQEIVSNSNQKRRYYQKVVLTPLLYHRMRNFF